MRFSYLNSNEDIKIPCICKGFLFDLPALTVVAALVVGTALVAVIAATVVIVTTAASAEAAATAFFARTGNAHREGAVLKVFAVEG